MNVAYKCMVCGGTARKKLKTLKRYGVCDLCAKGNTSTGERSILNYLIKNNWNFHREFKFKDLRYKGNLRFDFAIIKQGKVIALIEFDGMQHYKESNYFDDKTLKIRDKIKDVYCKKNNIPLLRIKYTKIKKIDELLSDFLKDF